MKTGKHFRLHPDDVLSKKYRVLDLLGEGWESEVYLVEEISTGVPRAAKLFFPKRNLKNKTLIQNAKKLYQLRSCPLLIQYFSHETTLISGVEVDYMISDYVQSQTLEDLLKKQSRKAFTQFEALHIVYELAKGLEIIHASKDYHGDLHSGNILIKRKGLKFDIKLIDFHNQPGAKKDLIKEDIVDLIHILYEILGGKKRYKLLRPEVKSIIMAKRRTSILKKFPKISDLKVYLENLEWT